MKGSVAAFIEASKDFLNSLNNLNFRLAILLTSNEEGTSKDGKLDVLLTDWYENGKKERDRTFKSEKVNGLRTEWYENGNMSITQHNKHTKEYV